MMQSIFDTDLYKFTTSYAYLKLYPNAEGTFTFNDRDNTQYDDKFVEDLQMEFVNLSHLSLRKEEMNWAIQNIRFLPSVYWEWLSSFRFNASDINVWLDDEKHLHIEVTDKMYRVTLCQLPTS